MSLRATEGGVAISTLTVKNCHVSFIRLNEDCRVGLRPPRNDRMFKTLRLYLICARISAVRGTDTESVEKWATPTFLLVKNVSSQKVEEVGLPHALVF
jgi:hypothetical protein